MVKEGDRGEFASESVLLEEAVTFEPADEMFRSTKFCPTTGCCGCVGNYQDEQDGVILKIVDWDNGLGADVQKCKEILFDADGVTM